MKQIIPIAAILCVALIAGDCSAGPPKGKRGQNANGQRRPRDGQQGQGPGARRDPAQMVARMMTEFDKDGDQKLDAAELTALLTSMHERRGGGNRAGGPKGRGRGGNVDQAARGRGKKDGNKPRANRKRRQRGQDKPGTPGGEKPKRPEAE